MSRKGPATTKCSNCSMTVAKKDLKSHQCLYVKAEIDSADDGENTTEIEFLESDYEANEYDSSAEDLTDLLTADWTDAEVEQLLDASLQVFEKGEVMDSNSFWTGLMESFNQNERWPLFVVKAKLRQLREVFQNDPNSLPKKLQKKLVKLSAMEKKNNTAVRRKVASSSEAKNEPGSGNLMRRSNFGDLEDDSDNESMRWTGRDIMQLIDSYKRHLNVMNATASNKNKRKIWEKIASEVKMSGDRHCDPYAARLKMVNLKRTWTKHADSGGRTSWPYFTALNQVMNLESRQNELNSDSDPEYAVEASSDEEESQASNKRFKGSSDQPEWFLRFRQEAKRRHCEKMKIKFKLLEVLESFVDKMNK